MPEARGSDPRRPFRNDPTSPMKPFALIFAASFIGILAGAFLATLK